MNKARQERQEAEEFNAIDVCCCCGRTFEAPANEVWHLSLSGAKEGQEREVCNDCIEEFERDCSVKLDSDELGQDAWIALTQWITANAALRCKQCGNPLIEGKGPLCGPCEELKLNTEAKELVRLRQENIRLRDLLAHVGQTLNMNDAEHPDFRDSCVDCCEHLWQKAADIREVLKNQAPSGPGVNVTLYCVHSDVDTGASLDVFTSEQAEREHCLKLMKENGTTRVQELIADGEFEEAWCLFNEQETGDLSYHFRHEVDVTL